MYPTPPYRLAVAGPGRQFELFAEQTGTGDLFRYGRDPDGTPAGPWSWDDLMR